MAKFNDFLNEQLQDAEFKAEWDALQPERAIIQAMIDARKETGLTQKQLAEVSSVALRMIQLYEQRQNDINKAQVSTLSRLARSLNCRMEDLMEPQIVTGG